MTVYQRDGSEHTEAKWPYERAVPLPLPGFNLTFERDRDCVVVRTIGCAGGVTLDHHTARAIGGMLTELADSIGLEIASRSVTS